MASKTSTATLLEGSNYVGEKLIGEGGMGVVLEARHRTLGHLVAVKLLHAHLADEDRLGDRLRIEGELLAKLASPYLVRVSDAGVTPRGDVFLVMERLVGTSLAQEIKARGPMPWREACLYVGQTLRGLAVVHQAGVVHRDIKPGNLFLCEGEQSRLCKVLDFGIAKILDGPQREFPLPIQPTAPGMVVGSARYMSPEQARGEVVDARSDIYSVGVVLYALLVGRGPFDDRKEFIDYCKAHAYDAPPRFAELTTNPIPWPLESLVMKALSKKREDRFGSAEAFIEAIDAAVHSIGRDPESGSQSSVSQVGNRPIAASDARSRNRDGQAQVTAPLDVPAPQDDLATRAAGPQLVSAPHAFSAAPTRSAASAETPRPAVAAQVLAPFQRPPSLRSQNLVPLSVRATWIAVGFGGALVVFGGIAVGILKWLQLW